MLETIYFDTCALNRLTDDLAQPRILAEATAVEQVLADITAGKIRWIGSKVVRLELSRNLDEDRREQTLALLNFAQVEPAPTQAAYQAAQALRHQGSMTSTHFILQYVKSKARTICSPWTTV